MENDEKQSDRIAVRTFGRAHGKRLSPRQQNLIDNLLPTIVPGPSPRSQVPMILEIGFGAGEHIIELAEQHPGKIILGAEPFINGVASLLSKIADNENEIKSEYKNIRIWPDDVRKLLAAGPARRFAQIWILHPDPWPKTRHEKRRLLSSDFLKSLRSFVSKDGSILIGTDHADYYDWIVNEARRAELKISIPKIDAVKTRYQEKDMFGRGRTQYLELRAA